jgi:hypothetical protein
MGFTFGHFHQTTRISSDIQALLASLEGRRAMSDIRKRIAEIDNGHSVCFEPTEGGEKFWHEGVGAFYKDLLIEQCPYPAGLVRDNWLRGWLAAEFVGFCEFEWPGQPG